MRMLQNVAWTHSMGKLVPKVCWHIVAPIRLVRYGKSCLSLITDSQLADQSLRYW